MLYNTIITEFPTAFQVTLGWQMILKYANLLDTCLMDILFTDVANIRMAMN